MPSSVIPPSTFSITFGPTMGTMRAAPPVNEFDIGRTVLLGGPCGQTFIDCGTAA